MTLEQTRRARTDNSQPDDLTRARPLNLEPWAKDGAEAERTLRAESVILTFPGARAVAASEEPAVPPPSPLLTLQPACSALQQLLGAAERRLAKPASGLPSRPVFVTGLPGGGGTKAFELLAGSDTYACFRQGDGPFVAAPRIARGLKRRFGDSRVGAPAALDGALWAFARRGEENPVHRVRSVIASLCQAEGKARYLGKNAGLITRLPTLQSAFPDAVIVAAFRDPAAQLARVPADLRSSSAEWLRCWIETYRRAAAAEGVVLLDADRLDGEGRPILRRLAQATDTPETQGLLDQLDANRRGAIKKALARNAPDLPPILLAEARALHWRLARQAI